MMLINIIKNYSTPLPSIVCTIEGLNIETPRTRKAKVLNGVLSVFLLIGNNLIILT